jgi:polysaccharide biosynthesis protein VpsM
MDDESMEKAIRNKTLFLSVCCALGLTSNVTQADDLFGSDVIFEPKLSVGARYDDNLTQAADDQPQDSSYVGVIDPSFTLGAEGSKSTVAVGYSIHQEIYEYSSKDDHTDHHFDISGDLRFTSRNAAGLSAGYHKQQDIRTSINRSDPNEITGDRYHWYYVGGYYKAGADSGRLQLKLAAETEERRYSNNLTTSSNNLTKERDTDTVIGTLYFRVAPKTRLLIEGKQRTFDYIDPNSGLDNDATTIYAGLEWEATAKTTGSIRVGQEDKSFDLAGKEDYSEASWDIGITWQPRSYTTVNLSTKQGAAEGSVFTDVIKTSDSTLAWSQEWTPKLRSDIRYNYLQEDYQGSTFDGRSDKTHSISLKGIFVISAGAEMYAGVTTKSRSSNSAIEEFDRNIAEIGISWLL